MIDTSEASGASPYLRSMRRLQQPPEALVIHSVPMAWQQVIETLKPVHTIGHTVWETDRLPTRWLHEMDVVDEFWVPTFWNQALFSDAFRRPVHVVPHVASTVEPVPPPIELATDHFVVAVVSAWDWRKRPDLAVRAFCNAFSAADPVTLVIKTTSRPVAWWNLAPVTDQVHAIVAEYPEAPRVIVETRQFTDSQMLGLLRRADCVLSLTSSEGWALGPFDAACLGTPVIMTGYGGQTEWLGGDYPGLIPFRMVDSDHPDRQLFEPGMQWALADVDAAVDQLRSLAEGAHRELTDRSATLAEELRQRYSPLSVAATIAPALPTELSRRARRPTVATPVGESVVVMTPAKNAAHLADGWCERLLTLTHPRRRLSVAVLVSDSTDGTEGAFEAALERLAGCGVTTTFVRRDFGFALPDTVPRWEPSIQLQRRTVLAWSRNHLLFASLGDEEWVLWLDADVVEYPPDIIERLVGVARATGADVVHPHCVVTPGGPSFDCNAWTDHGAFHLDDYRGLGAVELHAVGATMLLVRADRHRDGLVWPAHGYGLAHAHARTDPTAIGRPGLGEVESEGLGLLASDMGILCLGLPDLEVRHVDG